MPLIQDDHLPLRLPNINNLRMTQREASSRPSASTSIPQDIRIKNRRRRYLERHPSYFSPELESADPLLYDRLVRRHFTPADREIERRQKGYAGTLEADLLRGEARLDEVQRQQPDLDGDDDAMSEHEDIGIDSDVARGGSQIAANNVTYTRTESGEIIAHHADDEDLSRDEAYDRWYEAMERRFLDGKDDDFEYIVVDESEEFDDVKAEERDREEEWFDEESPDMAEELGLEGKKVGGETGVQDF